MPTYRRFNPRACVRRDELAAIQTDPRVAFQSTRLREARLFTAKGVTWVAEFQSTRLREARHTRENSANPVKCFNPRACVRRD